MSQSPEAYERLILDAMRGDATLFTRNDEVDAQWSIIDPVLEALARDRRRRPAADVRGRHGRPGRGRRAARRPRVAQAVSEDVWSARDTTPSAIEAALRELLGRRYQEDRTFVPARVMNLVVIVDRELPRRGREPARARRPLPPVAARDRRGRGGPHAARRVGDGGRRRRRAQARATSPSGASGSRSTIGPQHLGKPRHDRRPAARLRPGDDGLGAARPPRRRRRAAPAGQHRAHRHAGRARGAERVRARRTTSTRSAYVVDLAWLRSTPWRERVAATFDPPAMRRCARRDRARSPSATATTPPPPACCSAAGSRRGWAGGPRRSAHAATADRPLPRAPRRGRARAAARGDGRARARRRDDRDGLGRVGRRSTAGPAGCAPCAARATASEQAWTVLGASRGEAGHPRRGRAPGAAARPDVQARARSGQDAGRA